MIRLGLRMAFGRDGLGRLALIGGAVAIGVAMLLGVLAGVNAVQAQNLRYSWLNSGVTSAATGPAAQDPAWWAPRQDYFHGRSIIRIDVAPTGPSGPVPPGMPALPGAGSYYASPALMRLIGATPAAELGARFPGAPAGVIGEDALPGPDALVIVVGLPVAEVKARDGAVRIDRIVAVSPSECDGCYIGIGGEALTLTLGVVGVALLFPMLMFVGTATRLAAARREQRFAAMRLLGATPRQVSTLATVESAVAAALGAVVGFGLYLPVRWGLAHIPFTGERFHPSHLTLTWPQIAAVLIGVPLGAAVAARLALRRVRISPLGVTRRVTPRPPRAWRLVPLAAGLAELAWFVGRRPSTSHGQLTAYLSGILMVMVGLIIAGPYLTLLGSRALARWSRHPAGLIAGRRLADDPRAGFRAVSGLMLALFVTSVATGVIGTMVSAQGDRSASAAKLAMTAFPEDLAPGEKGLSTAAIPASLSTIPGVRAVQVVHYFDDRGDPGLPGLIPCADLAALRDYGSCPPGAEVARVFSDLAAPDGIPTHWEAAPVSAASLEQAPVLSLVVLTDGSPAAVETSRTVMESAFPALRPPLTDREWNSDFARTLVQFQRLADIVVVTSLVIAGCALAVAVTGGLNERKRPFSLLRLTGVRLAELRRVVTLESAVPLLAVSVVAIAAGFLSAHLFLRSQLQDNLVAPSASYYALVALGLAVSLALIASTMPLLGRITGPGTARNE
ncbi:FtsX-like permease family protein [Paractinoplanes atraurantiacus]|uniref:FtsX-like permease family protein n=1 Tax=Paractinoplanes atraurantiacus TaxID=1036182 RepID=A0A285ICL1_9ACTN|nr:FtsX-like permease family protein [Actinoplanes atraurantiacus]SNY45700.1 FtsX-like permease family protein [Actinoplanes atraurantiacus]